MNIKTYNQLSILEAAESAADRQPLKEGMTNDSFLFSTEQGRFIIRYPGKGSNDLVNRRNEYNSYMAIRGIGIADEPVYIDGDSGIKITPYFEGARQMDIDNAEEVKRAFALVRRLHSKRLSVRHEFNHWDMYLHYEQLLEDSGVQPAYADYPQARERSHRLYKAIMATRPPRILCHNDTVYENILILPDGDIKLIDWEYAGMCDPINDIAMHCLYNYYDADQSARILEIYLGWKPNTYELYRLFGWSSIAALLWYLWTLYKESKGISFGDYGDINYRLSAEFAQAAQEMYKRLGF